MADSDLTSIVTRARSGDPATFAALIAALQRDLRSFIATFAGSRVMLEACERATWGECRRLIAKCPASDEAATWVRELAMAQIRPRLEADLRQAVAAKDAVLHLALQDGLESLRALSGPVNADAQQIAGRYPTLTEPLQVVIARRYTDRASLAELAKERSISEAELAIRLFVARASLHPRATATDARPPSDRLLPAQIEQALNGSLPAAARTTLAASLLKDLSRAAAFTRQLRVDLLLDALFGPDQDAVALANDLLANDKKRRNESSLLQVVAPPRVPVSSGSELRRTGEVLAAKQSRPTSDGTRRLARKTEEAKPTKSTTRLKRSSRPALAAGDDNDERPVRSNRNLLYIGGGLALIGLIGLVVLWNSGGPTTPTETTSGVATTAPTSAGIVARVASTSGTATVLDEGKRSAASEGQSLRSGQGVDVGEKSSLVLEIPELARLDLRAGTQIGALAERGAQRNVHVLLTQGALTATVTGDQRILIVLTALGRLEMVTGTCLVTATSGRLGVEVTSGTAQLARADGSRAIAIGSGKRGSVTDRDDPRIDAGSVFLRGINLGGNVVTVERNTWLSHRQALSGGLALHPGTEIAPPASLSAPGLDFDLKSLLDTGLTANAGPIHVKQKVPNGDYDVSLWLTGTRGVNAEGLLLNQRETPIGPPTTANENWWRIGPYRVTVTDKLLDVQITCTNTTRLSGMALYGSGSPPPVLPVTLTVVSPADSASLYTSDTITLRSEALGVQGITVSYFNNDVPLGDSAKGPAYAVTLASPKAGNYRITARTTNGGEVSQSLPVSFTLNQAGGTGTITWNRWDGLGGDKINNASGNSKLNGKPNQTRQLNEFEAPSNSADEFFARIRGYVVPPTTGEYVFWIASDDEGELLLSSDDQPANKKRIAHCENSVSTRDWGRSPNQQSKPVTLIAGTRYYIEAVYKEGKVSDHCAVGWKLPNGTLERPIPGAHLVPYSGP